MSLICTTNVLACGLKDVVFSGANFLWQHSTGQSIWQGPWVLSSVPCILIVVRMKSPILLGLEEEVFSTETAFVSFLPSRFLLSLDFWSFLVPSYSFKSMMLLKRCFYILPSISVV